MIVALLRLVVRLLPGGDWGRAMLAEVEAIGDPRARRRFALGCLRAALTQPESRLRIGGIAVVVSVPALLYSGPGGSREPAGLIIGGVAIAICLVAVMHVQDLPVVARLATAGGCLWWAGILASATVRSHPEWALVVVVACVVAADSRGGAVVALGTAFATCLAVFVLAAATYATLPQLAPPIAPANAADPRLENRIESTDPYVAELLLAALSGLALTGAVRARLR